MLSLFSASMVLMGVSQAFWKRQFAAGEAQYRSRQGKGRCCGQSDVVAVGRKHVQKECYHCRTGRLPACHAAVGRQDIYSMIQLTSI